MQKQNNQPVTKKDLGEFAEDVLLPAIERIIDERVPKIIDERVPKIIDEIVPPMINRAKLELMDHFDDKIADLRGDIILLFRKDDRRFLKLVEILHQKKVLDKGDIQTIEEFQLFPQIVK